MRLVIADTGPVNYLILIGHINLLPHIFERAVLPAAVQAELSNHLAPLAVQRWVAQLPAWVGIAETPVITPQAGVHRGEAAAIALAATMRADLLLIDDRKGVRAAAQQGLEVTGTLGLLDLAAERGLLDFAGAVRALEGTNFRRPEKLLHSLLSKHSGTHKPFL